MYTNYTNKEIISNVEHQKNIMILVGNGFDISFLNKYFPSKPKPTYSKFYDYLIYHNDVFNVENVIFKEMETQKKISSKNWADFESHIKMLAQDPNIESDRLQEDFKEIQTYFLYFLNEIVTNEVLVKIDEESPKNLWARKSLSKFLGDISKSQYLEMSFPKNTKHYTMFNYLIFNFNYTNMLDSYLYLDKTQFDPKPHKTVETNFGFYPDPNNYNNYMRRYDITRWSTFILTDIFHPHGHQNIPRSMLFGVEDNSTNELKDFSKPYWSQANYKYKPYFKETDLFIIYGLSLGETDSWWWEQIYLELKNDAEKNNEKKCKELIIYFYDNASEYTVDDVKKIFINHSNSDDDADKVNLIKNRIYVVIHNDNNLNFLGFKNE